VGDAPRSQRRADARRFPPLADDRLSAGLRILPGLRLGAGAGRRVHAVPQLPQDRGPQHGHRRAIAQATPSSEQYALFRSYIDARHGEGGMADMSAFDYATMVRESHVQTRIIEYRLRGADTRITGRGEGPLLAVALTDILADGLSMVYSFFDPDSDRRSLGTFLILDHIAKAQTLGFLMSIWATGSPDRARWTTMPVHAAGAPDAEGWAGLVSAGRAAPQLSIIAGFDNPALDQCRLAIARGDGHPIVPERKRRRRMNGPTDARATEDHRGGKPPWHQLKSRGQPPSRSPGGRTSMCRC